jgi:NADH:ubiquinone oxidoreductase subunit F (NADH-binding)
MTKDTVLRIRGLYEEWIRDDTTALEKETIFQDLLAYTKDVQRDICGKCIPCRDGIPIIRSFIEKFEAGKASMEDLQKMEDYVANLRSSLCSVGIDYGKSMEVVLRNNFNDFHKKAKS